jgi:hypothetical protein
VGKGIHVTKRDLFYTDVKLFSKQEEVVPCLCCARREEEERRRRGGGEEEERRTEEDRGGETNKAGANRARCLRSSTTWHAMLSSTPHEHASFLFAFTERRCA